MFPRWQVKSLKLEKTDMGKGEAMRQEEWGKSAWMCEGVWGAGGWAPAKLQAKIRLERKLQSFDRQMKDLQTSCHPST